MFYLQLLCRRLSCTGVAALFPAALCFCLLGCGSEPETPTGTVKGRVTLGDQPYTNATVVFLSLQSGKGATGEIQPDGSYTLSTPLPVGSYKVYLAPKPEPGASDEAPVKIDTSVPENYWNETTTDISAEVTEGENEVPVNLKKQ